MKISVVVTCYNEGSDLIKAVRSVQAQTYCCYELIIVKDFCDHQETIKVCHKLESEGIRVIYADSNVGVSVTRNMGISLATGDIIYTVDADDELPENALEVIVDAFSSNPQADVVFGDYKIIEGDSTRIVDCSILVENNNDNMLRIDSFLSCGVLPYGQNAIKREVAIRYPFSERYSFGCQDYELQLRMLEQGVSFVYVPHVLYKWYRKPTGINSSKRNAVSYDMCMYEHLETVAPFISRSYLFSLCKSFNDKAKFRGYFLTYAPKWCKWLSWLPLPLLSRLQRFINE